MTAPNFCMLLRKHVQNARIVSISQPGLERIVIFELEHLDELGDLRRKKLIVEIMGKHSNIIFCDEDNKILDSIKHISGLVSSVREVLPGKPWFIPHTQEKFDPLTADRALFMEQVFLKPCDCFKAAIRLSPDSLPQFHTKSASAPAGMPHFLRCMYRCR